MDVVALLAEAKERLQGLDRASDLGMKKSAGDQMKEGGKALQELAERLRKTAKSDQVFANLAADYYELRGLGYEGEGILTEKLGMIRAARSGIPKKFAELAKNLVRIRAQDFGDCTSQAHGFQVQTMIALGRFHARLPAALRSLDKARQWLQEAIDESPRNPAKNAPVVTPILPRLYLAEVLRAAGDSKEKVAALLQEAGGLLKRPLSLYEAHLADYLQRLHAQLAAESLPGAKRPG